MRDADHTAGLPPQPDPPQDRPTKPVPPNIADLLVIVRILLGYGRHLAQTLERRAAGRGFATIAQFFGTARLPVIQAQLARGLLRAVALEQVLLARAARGRDLVFYTRRDPDDRPPQPAHAQPPAVRRRATPAPAGPPPRPGRAPRSRQSSHPGTANGATSAAARSATPIADICRDLGVAPTLCDGILWNALYQRRSSGTAAVSSGITGTCANAQGRLRGRMGPRHNPRLRLAGGDPRRRPRRPRLLHRRTRGHAALTARPGTGRRRSAALTARRAPHTPDPTGPAPSRPRHTDLRRPKRRCETTGAKPARAAPGLPGNRPPLAFHAESAYLIPNHDAPQRRGLTGRFRRRRHN